MKITTLTPIPRTHFTFACQKNQHRICLGAREAHLRRNVQPYIIPARDIINFADVF